MMAPIAPIQTNPVHAMPNYQQQMPTVTIPPNNPSATEMYIIDDLNFAGVVPLVDPNEIFLTYP